MIFADAGQFENNKVSFARVIQEAAQSKRVYELPTCLESTVQCPAAAVDPAALVPKIAAQCRLLPDAVRIVNSEQATSGRAAGKVGACKVLVQYQIDLRRGLEEDAALRESCVALLKRLLVHDPCTRATWEEFFKSSFVG